MDTDIDWPRELDAAVAAAPDRPVAGVLLAGRRAVRRRRLATASAALAVVVLGGSTWTAVADDLLRAGGTTAVAGGTSPRVSFPGYDSSLPTRPSDVGTAGPDEMARLAEGNTVTATDDGSLVVRPGWRVDEVEEQELLFEGRVAQRSWAVSTSPVVGGSPRWTVVEWERSGEITGRWEEPGQRFEEYDQWLGVVSGTAMRTGRGAIAHTEDGRLVMDADLEVIDQHDGPVDLPVVPAGWDAVAAEVRLLDGTSLFVLASPDGSMAFEASAPAAQDVAALLRAGAPDQPEDGGE